MRDKDTSELPDLASQLQVIFKRNNWHALWLTFSLVRNWSEIVGKKIAKRSEPAYIKKNILWVQVRDSVWMQHLQSMKPQLLERVKSSAPEAEISDIRWIMQPADLLENETHDKRPVVHNPDPKQQKAFEQIASIVENKECRKALCKLWQTYHSTCSSDESAFSGREPF